LVFPLSSLSTHAPHFPDPVSLSIAGLPFVLKILPYPFLYSTALMCRRSTSPTLLRSWIAFFLPLSRPSSPPLHNPDLAPFFDPSRGRYSFLFEVLSKTRKGPFPLRLIGACDVHLPEGYLQALVDGCRIFLRPVSFSCPFLKRCGA